MSREIDVGGDRPGRGRWLDDHIASVRCYGHHDACAVYRAACHEGADLDDVEAVPDGADPFRYVVGPRRALVWAGYIDASDDATE